MKCIEELVSLEMLIDFNAVKVTILLVSCQDSLLLCSLWVAVMLLSCLFSFQWVPLVVSGRFLVHEGSVRQLTVDSTYGTRVSFISVHVHLFNDLLIISTKKYVTHSNLVLLF